MCCWLTTLLLLGPRFALLVWWVTSPQRFGLAFHAWIWPLLGGLFLPWTTLVYLLVFPGGVTGLDWLWLGLGLAVDLGALGGSGYGNRDRLRGEYR